MFFPIKTPLLLCLHVHVHVQERASCLLVNKGKSKVFQEKPALLGIRSFILCMKEPKIKVSLII